MLNSSPCFYITINAPEVLLNDHHSNLFVILLFQDTNAYLSHHVYFVGYQPTLADIILYLGLYRIFVSTCILLNWNHISVSKYERFQLFVLLRRKYIGDILYELSCKSYKSIFLIKIKPSNNNQNNLNHLNNKLRASGRT